MTLNRREFLGATGVLGGAAALTSLGAASSAGASPVRGGILDFGLTNTDSGGFNPAYSHLDGAGFQVFAAVYDPLMVIDANGKPQPYLLAVPPVPNKTFTSWTLTLRPGIKFHDGTPLDGSALLANVQAWFRSDAVVSFAVKPTIIGGTKVGPMSVRIDLKVANSSYPFALASQQTAFIAAPSTLNAKSGHHPIGTGPFRFKSWNGSLTDTIEFERNPSYWRAGLPYLDGIRFHPLTDGPSRLLALQGGAIDIATITEADMVKTLHANHAGLTWLDTLNDHVIMPPVTCLQLNCGSPASKMRNPKLRQAFCMSIDRHALAAAWGRGSQPAADSLFPTWSPYGGTASVLAYNPTKAAALVASLPVAQRTFSFAFPNGSPVLATQAATIKKYAAAAGLTVVLKPIDQSDLINNALFGNYDSTMWAQFGGVSPDENYIWWSTTTESNTGLVSINMARNVDPAIEAAMRAGMATKSLATKASAWTKVNTLLCKDLAYIPVYFAGVGVVSKTSVHWQNPTTPNGAPGYVLDRGQVRLAEVWMS